MAQAAAAQAAADALTRTNQVLAAELERGPRAAIAAPVAAPAD